MNLYDAIKGQLGQMVPFARHTGVELVSVEAGRAEARVPQTDRTANHIGTQHAGALFTLGEAASGGAAAGAFAPKILEVRPVAARASIDYRAVARGTITARAETDRPAGDLLAAYEADGKAVFGVDVILTDEDGREVSAMRVDWHFSPARR